MAAIAADLTDPQQVEHLCSEAAARLGGPIDILVNNAGDVLDMRPLLEAPLSAWHDTLALDLTAAMLTSRLLAPAMREARLGQDHQHLLDLRPHRRRGRGHRLRGGQGRPVGDDPQLGQEISGCINTRATKYWAVSPVTNRFRSGWGSRLS